MKVRGLLPIAVVVLLPLGARAEDRPRVGLIPHPVVNLDSQERDQLTREIGRALTERFAIEVVYGDRYSGNLPDDCVAQPSCTQKVARELRADYLLFLVMAKVGTRTQVDPVWVDVGSGRTSSRDPFTLDGGAEARQRALRDAVPALVPRGVARPVAGPSPQGPGVTPRSEPWQDTSESEEDEVSVAPWVASGVAVAALGIGLALVLGGIGEYNALLESQCDMYPGRCKTALDNFGTRSLVADMLLAGAGVAGAMAVVLFAGESDDEPSGAVALEPSRDGVRFGLGGRF